LRQLPLLWLLLLLLQLLECLDLLHHATAQLVYCRVKHTCNNSSSIALTHDVAFPGARNRSYTPAASTNSSVM
jgi:hypothetical protein